MPGDKYDEWVRNTFGADPSGGGAPPQAAPPQAAPPHAAPNASGLEPDDKIIGDVQGTLKEIAAERERLQKAGLDLKFLDTQVRQLQARLAEARADTEERTRHRKLWTVRDDAQTALSDFTAQQRTATTGTTDAIEDLRGAAAKQVAKLPKSKHREELQHRLDELGPWLERAAAETNPRKHKFGIEAIEMEAESILNDAAKHSGDEKARQKAYADALEHKFGFVISNPVGMKNTHFDRVYEMLDKVPVGHVVQEQLKELTYYASGEEARFGLATIAMGEFGAKPADAMYYDPAGREPGPLGPRPADNEPRESPQNSFDISTLHELGHSVDERWGVMDAHKGKAGCGSWRDEDVDTVAQTITDKFLGGLDGLGYGGDAEAAHAAILSALKTGKATKPKKMPPSDWEILAITVAKCASMKTAAAPWDKAEAPEYDGRVYVESYDNLWYSCDAKKWHDRAITVRGYQWRSPKEFFAELYAYSWMTRRPPPRGVEDAIKQYMYQDP